MLVDLLAYKRLETMRTGEHLILLGETMIILMSISGPVIASSLAGHGGRFFLLPASNTLKEYS